KRADVLVVVHDEQSRLCMKLGHPFGVTRKRELGRPYAIHTALPTRFLRARAKTRIRKWRAFVPICGRRGLRLSPRTEDGRPCGRRPSSACLRRFSLPAPCSPSTLF